MVQKDNTDIRLPGGRYATTKTMNAKAMRFHITMNAKSWCILNSIGAVKQRS